MMRDAERSVRDRLWLWVHEAGAYNGQYGLPGVSRIAPHEACADLGVPNAAMIRYADKPRPPFDDHAQTLASLKRVAWSIVGDSSSIGNNTRTDLDEVVSLARRFSNIRSAVLDDFFHVPDATGRCSRWDVADVAQFHKRLHANTNHALDLWVVVYTHDLHLPIARHLGHCDVLTLWTWKADELVSLEANLGRLESIAPGKRILIGVYLWDFGNERPMPLPALRRQCEQGLEWIKQGRIEGMVFVASTILDLNLDAVQWLREWIKSL